ncbi:MAG: alpha/beta hydrolase [Gammaproteobacteria bacterium]|nr:alpha/beta hydrolase [Gammaproteobacteria bacterium]
MRLTGRFFALALLWCLACSSVVAETRTRVADPVFHGEVNFMVSGPAEAPTVLLVHGLGDKASQDWDGLAAALSKNYRVVRFDLPGFGQSSKGNLAYTPDNYARFLHALVNREVRTRPFFLIGHSMGGAIALRYAANYPQNVSALVLVDVPAILHRFVYSKHMAAFGLSRMVPGLYLGDNDVLGNMLGNILGKVERKPLPVEMVLQIPALRQKFLKGEPTLISGLALALEDFGRDIPRVRAPTLLLWGERDDVAPLRSGRVLAANLPRARLVVFPGVGHVPMDDAPKKFQSWVEEFLRNPVIPEQENFLREDTPLPESTRHGRCQGQSGQVFEGNYDSIDIENCEKAVLRHVHAHRLRVTASSVTIEDSRIGSGAEGLVAERSRVTITSSRIEGKAAIVANDSRLDIAGSRIVGQSAAVMTRTTAEAAFSVSQVESENNYGPLHGLRFVTPEMPL